MKYINISFITLLATLLIIGACKKDNLEPEGNWELSSPVVTTPSASAAIVLNENTPDEEITFTWEAAASSAGYGVYYTVLIDSAGSTNFDTPILEITSKNGGKDLSASVAYSVIDEALSLAGYPANTEISLSWAVKASSLSKSSFNVVDIKITRFATEIIPTKLFLSGEATENGTDLSQAIPLRNLNNANGKPSNKHEIYTSLKAGKTYKFYSEQSMPAHQYGGSEGNLVKAGNAITAEEDGQYRISVDLDNNTYSLLKIESMAFSSDMVGGWDPGAALDYQGGGIWSKKISLGDAANFAFKAEVAGTDWWTYLFKPIEGLESEVVIESEASSQGLTVTDVVSDKSNGDFIVKIDLSANSYTWSIERDPNDTFLETPESLYLLENGTSICTFVKDGDKFNSEIYLALQASSTYSLNTKADGTGTNYVLNANIGNSTEGDKVQGNSLISQGEGEVSIDNDQAYFISINFQTITLSWSYYNIKIFHWDDLGDGWDDRAEIPMTYVHPYQFTASSVTINANYDTKFNSPWDVQFGVDASNGDVADALSGSTTNGGSNFRNIPSGIYDVTLTINNDYSKGTYEFATK